MVQQGLCVLVVDDDPAIRRLIRRCLEPEGFAIVEAEDTPPLPPPSASDERAGDPLSRGEDLARRECAVCHAIDGPGPSPVADALPFSALSERYPVRWLEEAFAEGIMVRHPSVQMPEFRLEPDEIEALMTYLESVQALP
jgi:mono/diheme cytochrome c family protein